MDLSAFALRFAKGTLLILGLDLGERHLTMEVNSVAKLGVLAIVVRSCISFSGVAGAV
jgi:hypothetical protein